MPAYDELLLALRETQSAVRENVPLAPMTHVRLGGPARVFVEPFTEVDLGRIVRVCRDLDAPMRMLGGGSNLVVADDGVDGVVVSLTSLNRIVREGVRLTAGAGVSLPTLLRGARELGLAGLEQLTGVPAQVGGAVAMNAGTRDGDTFERLVSLTVVDRDGEIRVLGPEHFAPRYRDGNLGEGSLVVHATFELHEDSPAAIFDRFSASLKSRNATQPVTERSVGCVFTNPAGDAAGRLIETAGCKLMREGGIVVSGKHANYFVNDRSGTADEFRTLMDKVQKRVSEVHGVTLVPEVQIWR